MGWHMSYMALEFTWVEYINELHRLQFCMKNFPLGPTDGGKYFGKNNQKLLEN